MGRSKHALPDQIARRIGACIYCRSTTGPLTDEHIVPAALDGNQVLAAACCTGCQVEIGRFEGEYLNSIRHVRDALGMGTRRQKAKRKTAPVRMTIGGVTRHGRLAFDDHVNAVALPVFPRARILADPDGDQTLRLDGEPAIFRYGRDPADVARAYGASRITLEQVIPFGAFAKLLAKIAYCEVVRIWGLEAVTDVGPLPALLGRTDDIGRWVGTALREGSPAADPNHIHSVQAKILFDAKKPDQPVVVHCSVMLFANAPAPVYEIVVGQLRPGTRPTTPTSSEEPIIAIDVPRAGTG